MTSCLFTAFWMTLIIVSRFIKIFDISLSKPSNHFDGDGDESIILL